MKNSRSIWYKVPRLSIICVLDQFLEDRETIVVPVPQVIGDEIDVVGRVAVHVLWLNGDEVEHRTMNSSAQLLFRMECRTTSVLTVAAGHPRPAHTRSRSQKSHCHPSNFLTLSALAPKASSRAMRCSILNSLIILEKSTVFERQGGLLSLSLVAQ